jgi:hypothetical protein
MPLKWKRALHFHVRRYWVHHVHTLSVMRSVPSTRGAPRSFQMHRLGASGLLHWETVSFQCVAADKNPMLAPWEIVFFPTNALRVSILCRHGALNAALERSLRTKALDGTEARVLRA